jgi:hypothetical protein
MPITVNNLIRKIIPKTKPKKVRNANQKGWYID